MTNFICMPLATAWVQYDKCLHCYMYVFSFAKGFIEQSKQSMYFNVITWNKYFMWSRMWCRGGYDLHECNFKRPDIFRNIRNFALYVRSNQDCRRYVRIHTYLPLHVSNSWMQRRLEARNAPSVSKCEECNYGSYAPPPITGKDSLPAFPSKLKASVALVAVHTVEVVPDKGLKWSLLFRREKHKQLSRSSD